MTGRRALTIVVVAGTATVGVAGAADAAPKPSLLSFASCKQVLSYGAARVANYAVPRYAADVVRAVPVPMPRIAPDSPDSPESVGAPAPPAVPSTAKTAPGGDEQASGTNNQESGVDEADIIKATAKRIVVLSGSTLRVFTIGDGGAAPAGAVAVPTGSELLIDGDRALVIGTRRPDASSEPSPIPGSGRDVAVGKPALPVAPETVLTEVDLSDPARPRIARSMSLAGSYVTSRLTGHVARVVVTSAPSDPASADVRRLAVRRFVPATTIRSRITGRRYRRGVVPCDQIRRPATYSGLDLTAVLTVDMRNGLQNVDRDAVLAHPDTVYASPRALYVASHRYSRALARSGAVPDGARTEIHRFDTSSEASSRYTGSGSVDGLLLNQFSLSEEEGVLRVASTNEPVWLPERGSVKESESSVTTLAAAGPGPLRRLGVVGGLGRGERIYAVRFVGKVGYVVTFRQVDPLYTVDLSNPAAPRVVGELKIPGYSAYLHPVDERTLIGVGQDATDEGRTTGTQVSLFDVANPAEPKLRSKITFPRMWSDAENEHRAFLWWAPRGLIVVPGSSPDFTGALAVSVRDGQLAEAGRIEHRVNGAGVPIVRSLVAGPRLFTLSDARLQSADLATLACREITPLDGAQPRAC